MDHYLYPSIVSLPRGYDCTVQIPMKALESCIHSAARNVKVILEATGYCDGRRFFHQPLEVNLDQGTSLKQYIEEIKIEDKAYPRQINPSYLEISIISGSEQPIFKSKRLFNFYSIYSCRHKKSFFSDNSYKYGSPPVIEQISKIGSYIDAYPVINLDRERDLGETILLINPYKRPILATIKTFDGRELPRIKIPSESARNIVLASLLKDDESQWAGHIQVTASNRVITFSLKHSFANPCVIFDHEHLDPFRGENTHEPVSLSLRKWIGNKVKK